jgi:hypothetical protein
MQVSPKKSPGPSIAMTASRPVMRPMVSESFPQNQGMVSEGIQEKRSRNEVAISQPPLAQAIYASSLFGAGAMACFVPGRNVRPFRFQPRVRHFACVCLLVLARRNSRRRKGVVLSHRQFAACGSLAISRRRCSY